MSQEDHQQQQKDKNKGKKCCAECGARESSTIHLLKCNKCLAIKYCSTEYQCLDWKQHKMTECCQWKPPLGMTLDVKASTTKTPASLFRDMLQVAKPKNVLCTCWCCGRLLKNCGNLGLNPNNDLVGPFWTSLFGWIISDKGSKERGRTVPVLWVLGEPGSMGYGVGVNPHGQATACVLCASQLLQDDSCHAEKHI